MAPVNICGDLDVALVLVEAGAQLVLCRPDAASLGSAVAELRSAPGARVAALVADVTDPAGEAAARAMARELFGDEALFVSTVAAAREMAARDMAARLRGSGRNGSGTV